MLDYIDPAILPLGFFLFTCSIVGIFGNFLIILCTVKTRRFRSPCHILICLTCLADILHLAGQFPFCIHLFGNLSSTQSQCYFMMVLPILGLTITGPLILAMGIDRFIAIKMPMMYRYYLANPSWYLFIQLLFPIAYSTTFLAYGYLETEYDNKNQVKCSVPLSLNGSSFEMFTKSNSFILLLVFLVYITIFVVLKSNRANSKFRVVFRSIAVTVFFLLFGWATAMITNIVIYKIPMHLKLFHTIQMYAGVTVNLAADSNVFIFYAINSEYRIAIKSVLCCSDINKVGSSYQLDRNSSYQGPLTTNKISRDNLGNMEDLSSLRF